MSKKFSSYKASAGSGKTYTLVKEYLTIALADPQRIDQTYKQILAITFTNKAAAEMKGRILKDLKEIAFGKTVDKSKDLQTELNISEEELRARCNTLHQHILHQYSDFSVCTIDSFMYRLVKRFSMELQLPSNFSVDMNEKEALSLAVDNLLVTMQRNELLKTTLLQYAEEKIEDDKTWRIEEDILELVNNILIGHKEAKETQLLTQKSLSDFLKVKEVLKKEVKEVEKTLISWANKAFDLIKEKGLSVEDFFYGEKGVFGYFKKIQSLDVFDDKLNGSYVIKTIEDGKWYTGTSNPAIDAIKDTLKTYYTEIETCLAAKRALYGLYKEVLKNINALCLLSEVQQLLKNYQQEKGLVFISDFNAAISSFIQNEPVPFIYERLGNRYKHFLIDEFQDTSTLQWLNLLPLLHNALSEGKFCMVVGDGKQSIYRWRGADIEQFVHLPNIKGADENPIVQEQQEALTRNYEHKTLDTNRRSRATIITFNNSLFNYLSEKKLSEKHKKIYKGSEQKTNDRTGGKVSISLIGKEVGNKQEQALKKTEGFIEEALNKGYGYKDIALLVRKNKESDTLVQHLTEKGHPVISSESLLLTKCPEVHFLLSFFSWFVSDKDAVAATAVLNYLKKELGHDIPDVVFFEIAKKPYCLPEIVQKYIPHFSAHIASLPLYEISTELIRVFKIEQKNALYLTFFLDEVASFAEQESASLYLFLQWWKSEGKRASVKIPESSNAIRIMTINKSKGLEFPIVILPFADWQIENNDNNILLNTEGKIEGLPVMLTSLNKKMQKTDFAPHITEEKERITLDSLNLLYVACTRAESVLHIISAEKRSEYIFSWLKSYIDSVSDLKTDTSDFHEWGSYPALEKKEHADPGCFLSGIEYRDIRSAQEGVAIKRGRYYGEQDKRKYGIAVHAVLAYIHFEKDINHAIQKALLSGLIKQEESKEIESIVRELINSPSLRAYFTEGIEVKNETELLAADGSIIRPDRIVSTPEQHTIIDFKTGEKAAGHVAQLQEYKNTLRSLSTKKVNAFLVYLPDEVVEVV
ncbi:MAG: UvrD-helicase domain-containing protein [Bacteroidetes bacterium]|nr:UvrD-helicase domain-containing protein [Bacteroidota bacterium]